MQIMAVLRSSFPPNISSSSPPFPSTITFENRRLSSEFPTDAFLFQSTVYRVAPLDPEPNPNRNGRLVKLEKSERSKMRYLHPLSNRMFRSSAVRFNIETLSKKCKDWNLLDLRLDEVARSYSLKYINSLCVPGIDKLVVFPEPTDADDVRDCIAIAVWDGGKLGFARSGDDKWTLIDEQNHHYDDVIVYNRQIYAVDRWGMVFRIDSSMRLLQFSPPLIEFGHWKHVVECGGELLVIDRFLDKEPPIRGRYDSSEKAVGFKAYKLDQEWGKWAEVKNLENRSIVLGNGCCFSVDALDFKGCIGNCIYYYELSDYVMMND